METADPDKVAALLELLRVTAASARDAREHAELMQERRDWLIYLAVRAGASQRTTADAAGLTKSRVVGLLRK